LVIGQSPTPRAYDRQIGALNVINAQSDAVRVTEIELGQIPLQVRLADVLIHAIETALEDG
jgi:hypothetical protein